MTYTELYSSKPSKCKKCGQSGDVEGYTSIWAFNVQYLPTGDVLRVECSRCGYAWFMEPMTHG